MGNSLALVALMVWPLAGALLFSRGNVPQAIIWTLLGGYLLLPPIVTINLPMVPGLNKDSVATLTAAVGAWICAARAPIPPKTELWIKLLLGLSMLAPVMTAFANPEPLIEGITYRPGLTYYDGITAGIEALLSLLPFILGYRFLSDEATHEALLRAFVIAGVVYSVPMLLEIRLSPQLNVWIYGFFAHDFVQMIRYGSYRPMVFLNHGLWVAMFALIAVLAAAARLRMYSGDTGRGGRRAVLLWLILVLVLCKSMASIIYAAVLVPVVLLAGPRRQMRLAALVACLVFAYPLARSAGLVPVEAITEWASAIQPERGSSLAFRFQNEDILLDRAMQKPWTGWGGWGRGLVVDPVTGRYTTIADGRWIILLGAFGIIGYIASFGLLCGAVLRAAMAARHHPVPIATAALALIMAANLIDLIPNATQTPITLLCAGALCGRAARADIRDPGSGVAQPDGPARGRPKLQTVL